MSQQKRFGGSFAPPVDDAKLARYEELASTCENRRVREHMVELITMLRKFRETGQSTMPARKNNVGVLVQELEPQEVERIWDYVPWPDECDVIGRAFDVLPVGETRNAAYHLLWFARELAADREPVTNDKL